MKKDGPARARPFQVGYGVSSGGMNVTCKSAVPTVPPVTENVAKTSMSVSGSTVTPAASELDVTPVAAKPLAAEATIPASVPVTPSEKTRVFPPTPSRPAPSDCTMLDPPGFFPTDIVCDAPAARVKCLRKYQSCCPTGLRAVEPAAMSTSLRHVAGDGFGRHDNS